MKNLSLLVGGALPAAVVTFCQSQAQAPTAQPQQQPPQAQQQVQPSQEQQQAEPQVYGRGRGGLPWAWNDRNRDGICDLTGQPAGQGRPVGFGGGRGRFARGFVGSGWGRGGRGRGGGGGGWRFFGYPPAQAPAQTAPSQPPKQ